MNGLRHNKFSVNRLIEIFGIIGIFRKINYLETVNLKPYNTRINGTQQNTFQQLRIEQRSAYL